MAVFLSKALGLAYRFGTVEMIVHVPEWQFRPLDDTVQYADTGPPQLARYLISAAQSPVLISAVGLPPGAVLDQVEFDACDDRPTTGSPMTLFVFDSPNNPPIAISRRSARVLAVITPTELAYTVGDTKLVRVRGLRSALRRLAVPNPRRHVELSAAGEPAAGHGDVRRRSDFRCGVRVCRGSGGVGDYQRLRGGNFCPNSPVTRRQMAVFLSKALGLSFY